MIKTDTNTVGGRIRQARTKSSMSIKDLAERVGVTPTYLGIVERGERRNPSKVLLQKIANETDTTVDWLINENTENLEHYKELSQAQKEVRSMICRDGTPAIDIPASIEYLSMLTLELARCQRGGSDRINLLKSLSLAQQSLWALQEILGVSDPDMDTLMLLSVK